MQRYPRIGSEVPRRGAIRAVRLETTNDCSNGGLLRFARNDGAYC
jgi:hypothetical protein